MGTCFVIQPFDKGPFDARFDEVLAPAITEAWLEPYRVDRDPSASIPINEIEAGIRNSEVCLADITTDNPNVWFELGYAIAAGKSAVLICSKERTTKFPFDVQHRTIIPYATHSPGDFVALKTAITQRLLAEVKKEAKMGKLSALEPTFISEGLKPHEIAALTTVMQNNLAPDDVASTQIVREDMVKAGFTPLAVGLALKGLVDKGYLAIREQEGYNETWSGYVVSPPGTDWLRSNEDQLVLRAPKPQPPRRPSSLSLDSDSNDIPF